MSIVYRSQQHFYVSGQFDGYLYPDSVGGGPRLALGAACSGDLAASRSVVVVNTLNIGLKSGRKSRRTWTMRGGRVRAVNLDWQ